VPPKRSDDTVRHKDLKDPRFTAETDSDPAEYVVGPDDKLPAFDRYVTWSDRDAATNEDVEYFWQGRSVGKGEAGIHGLVKEMLQLPRGYKVLFYPDYRADLPSGGLFIVPPYFGHEEDELREAARRKHLVIINSQRDRLGNLVPRPRP
jgi:hypothetical protein